MQIKSILAFSALVAPVFSLAINEPASGLTVAKREDARLSSARLALAKSRAARKTKRDTENLAERAIEDSLARSGVSRRDFETAKLSKRQLPRERCSVRQYGSAEAASAHCVTFYASKGVLYDADATAACYATTPGSATLDLCQIRCPAGYTTITTDTSVQCVANTQRCTRANGQVEICPLDGNGFSYCDNGRCRLQCTTRGYTLNPRNRLQCVNNQVQANRCGPNNIRCPRAYNNNRNFAPACVQGVCTLSCPRGQEPYFVGTTGLQSCRPRQ